MIDWIKYTTNVLIHTGLDRASEKQLCQKLKETRSHHISGQTILY